MMIDVNNPPVVFQVPCIPQAEPYNRYAHGVTMATIIQNAQRNMIRGNAYNVLAQNTFNNPQFGDLMVCIMGLFSNTLLQGTNNPQQSLNEICDQVTKWYSAMLLLNNPQAMAQAGIDHNGQQMLVQDAQNLQSLRQGLQQAQQQQQQPLVNQPMILGGMGVTGGMAGLASVQVATVAPTTVGVGRQNGGGITFGARQQEPSQQQTAIVDVGRGVTAKVIQTNSSRGVHHIGRTEPAPTEPAKAQEVETPQVQTPTYENWMPSDAAKNHLFTFDVRRYTEQFTVVEGGLVIQQLKAKPEEEAMSDDHDAYLKHISIYQGTNYAVQPAHRDNHENVARTLSAIAKVAAKAEAESDGVAAPDAYFDEKFAIQIGDELEMVTNLSEAAVYASQKRARCRDVSSGDGFVSTYLVETQFLLHDVPEDMRARDCNIIRMLPVTESFTEMARELSRLSDPFKLIYWTQLEEILLAEMNYHLHHRFSMSRLVMSNFMDDVEKLDQYIEQVYGKKMLETWKAREKMLIALMFSTNPAVDSETDEEKANLSVSLYRIAVFGSLRVHRNDLNVMLRDDISMALISATAPELTTVVTDYLTDGMYFEQAGHVYLQTIDGFLVRVCLGMVGASIFMVSKL